MSDMGSANEFLKNYTLVFHLLQIHRSLVPEIIDRLRTINTVFLDYFVLLMTFGITRCSCVMEKFFHSFW